MSSLVLEIRRVPKAGKFFEVIDAMRKAMSETERIGMVTATATSSHLFNKDVVTTSRLNNIDELELIEDNVFTSSDFQKKASSIEELCSKTTTIQVLNMISEGDGFPPEGSPKYLRRNFLLAKRGEAQSLLEVLLEWKEEIKGVKPTIGRPIAGNQDMVRISVPFDSLAALTESGADIINNAAYDKYKEQVNRLTVSVQGTNNRVVHVNTP